MNHVTIPSGYRMPLTNNELQRAIELIHADFQHNLTVRLNLHRVSAPSLWMVPPALTTIERRGAACGL